MRLVAIVRMYNEIKTGHAKRFFEHWKEWGADALLVLDDCSDDGTYELAKQFTPYVWRRIERYTRFREMENSIFLIERCTDIGADYILFMDADEVLTKGAGELIKNKWLSIMDQSDFSALNFTTYSLWKTPRYRRWDSLWDCEMRFPRIWKNKDLHYEVPGPNQLHALQAPLQVYRHWYPVPDQELAILHYAYASQKDIEDRFQHYVEIDGKHIGWYPRIMDETGLVLERIPNDRYPLDLVPGHESEYYPGMSLETVHKICEAIGKACWKDRPIEEIDTWWESTRHTEEVRTKLVFERPGRDFIFPKGLGDG